jgi:hypothetical protein
MGQAILTLITAIFSGVLGGVLGALIVSHSDRQGRLFDKRSVVFGDFITKLNAAIERIVNIAIEDEAVVLNEWADTLLKYLMPVYNQERIVRLFLLEKDRDVFSDAFDQILEQLDNYNVGQPVTNLRPWEQINDIERIFFANLEPESFYKPIFRKLKLDVFISKCKTKVRSR